MYSPSSLPLLINYFFFEGKVVLWIRKKENKLSEKSSQISQSKLTPLRGKKSRWNVYSTTCLSVNKVERANIKAKDSQRYLTDVQHMRFTL